ncbi:M12 family metallopeptidase [Bacillus wiedmannii]|uniref:M12 family metallopeptidase n=1 Tax=Bacillus wiedmannii TaxID=1890302 RepID=UPI002EB29914|nr:M12 family metallopeptidase [Bacillus wiedmannii]
MACIKSGEEYRWTNGIVPYLIDSTLPDQERVTRAIAHWEEKTVIRFVIRTDEPNYVVFTPSSDEDLCESMTGMTGGRQEIIIGDDCSEGNMKHEIGHAVGLAHEHCREDRNDYVQINDVNIKDNKVKNFDQKPEIREDSGPYDYNSIMHYGMYAHSKNGLPTVEPKQSEVEIGQRDNLSEGDIVGVNLMYAKYLKSLDFGERFRAVSSYAGNHGFGGAFPNFHQLDVGDGRGVLYGVVCIKPEAVEVRSVPASELGDPRDEGERFRAVSSYAGNHGFGAAFPDCHQLDVGDGRGVLYGVVCIKPEAVEVRSVPASELGDPRDEGERFRAVSSYAGNHGFGAAFPDCHQLDVGDGRGVLYGVVCIKPEAVEVRSVPVALLSQRL